MNSYDKASSRKVCCVITARPSYSRVKSVLKAIKDHPQLELQLVLAGSALVDRYGNVAKTIEEDGFVVTEKIFNIQDVQIQGSLTGIIRKYN